jgi:hypothetical protein
VAVAVIDCEQIERARTEIRYGPGAIEKVAYSAGDRSSSDDRASIAGCVTKDHYGSRCAGLPRLHYPYRHLDLRRVNTRVIALYMVVPILARFAIARPIIMPFWAVVTFRRRFLVAPIPRVVSSA